MYGIQCHCQDMNEEQTELPSNTNLRSRRPSWLCECSCDIMNKTSRKNAAAPGRQMTPKLSATDTECHTELLREGESRREQKACLGGLVGTQPPSEGMLELQKTDINRTVWPQVLRVQETALSPAGLEQHKKGSREGTRVRLRTCGGLCALTLVRQEPRGQKC